MCHAMMYVLDFVKEYNPLKNSSLQCIDTRSTHFLAYKWVPFVAIKLYLTVGYLEHPILGYLDFWEPLELRRDQKCERATEKEIL